MPENNHNNQKPKDEVQEVLQELGVKPASSTGSSVQEEIKREYSEFEKTADYKKLQTENQDLRRVNEELIAESKETIDKLSNQVIQSYEKTIQSEKRVSELENQVAQSGENASDLIKQVAELGKNNNQLKKGTFRFKVASYLLAGALAAEGIVLGYFTNKYDGQAENSQRELKLTQEDFAKYQKKSRESLGEYRAKLSSAEKELARLASEKKDEVVKSNDLTLKLGGIEIELSDAYRNWKKDYLEKEDLDLSLKEQTNFYQGITRLLEKGGSVKYTKEVADALGLKEKEVIKIYIQETSPKETFKIKK